MTNYEKYKDEIIKCLERNGTSVTENGEVKACLEAQCKECIFYVNAKCLNHIAEWLNADAETGRPANTIKMLMAKHPDEDKTRPGQLRHSRKS